MLVLNTKVFPNRGIQIDSSTIDGNVEFVTLSVQLYSNVTSVKLVFVSDKMIINSDNFGTKCLSYGKISAFLCFMFSVFTLFYLILENK